MANITKRGESYRIKVSLGYDVEGKQITRSTTWTPEPGMSTRQIEKELNRAAVLFEEHCKNGGESGNIKFADYAELWFRDYAETHLKRKTVHEYRGLSRRTYAAIGHIRVDKLRPQHFRDFFRQLAQPGQNMKNGKPLSSKTIWNYYCFCSTVMSYAVKNEVIDHNPCSIAAPKKQPSKIKCLDDEQAVIFLNQLENEPMQDRVFFTLALFTGYRRGELLGLEWPDVDLEQGVITVRRTSQYVPESGIYTDTPKTASSARSTKISPALVELLRQYKREQAETMIERGDFWSIDWHNHPRLFTGQNGRPMSGTHPQDALKRILKHAGLPHVTIHSLRHTNASLMIAGGVDVRTVAARLGHTQTSTTLNIYAEAIRSAEAAAAEVLDDILLKKA